MYEGEREMKVKERTKKGQFGTETLFFSRLLPSLLRVGGERSTRRMGTCLVGSRARDRG